MGILLFVSAVVLLSYVLHECSKTHGYAPQRNMSRFVSDEEVVAASPTQSREVALRVREIVSEQLDVPLNNIHPDDRLVEELGAW